MIGVDVSSNIKYAWILLQRSEYENLNLASGKHWLNTVRCRSEQWSFARSGTPKPRPPLSRVETWKRYIMCRASLINRKRCKAVEACLNVTPIFPQRVGRRDNKAHYWYAGCQYWRLKNDILKVYLWWKKITGQPHNAAPAAIKRLISGQFGAPVIWAVAL